MATRKRSLKASAMMKHLLKLVLLQPLSSLYRVHWGRGVLSVNFARFSGAIYKSSQLRPKTSSWSRWEFLNFVSFVARFSLRPCNLGGTNFKVLRLWPPARVPVSHSSRKTPLVRKVHLSEGVLCGRDQDRKWWGSPAPIARGNSPRALG